MQEHELAPIWWVFVIFRAHILWIVFQSGGEIVSVLATLIAQLRGIPCNGYLVHPFLKVKRSVDTSKAVFIFVLLSIANVFHPLALQRG